MGKQKIKYASQKHQERAKKKFWEVKKQLFFPKNKLRTKINFMEPKKKKDYQNQLFENQKIIFGSIKKKIVTFS